MFILTKMYIKNKDNNGKINEVNTVLCDVRGTFRLSFVCDRMVNIHSQGINLYDTPKEDIVFILQDVSTHKSYIYKADDFCNLVSNDEVFLSGSWGTSEYSVTVVPSFAYELSRLLVLEEMRNREVEDSYKDGCSLTLSSFITRTNGRSFSSFFPDFMVQHIKSKTNIHTFIISDDSLVFYDYGYGTTEYDKFCRFRIKDRKKFDKILAKGVLLG